MKEYETGMTRTISAVVLVAIIVTVGVFGATQLIPPGSTTPTTTPTNPPAGGHGPLAVDYIDSKRDDIEFFWMCNCSFVNEDLSGFYQETTPGAFVDGVYMIKNDGEIAIRVLFSPYSENLIGEGTISTNEWEQLSGSIVDDGIGQMTDAQSHPNEFPAAFPITLYMSIYFNDNTFFVLGYTLSDGMVFIQNGTWTGDLNDWGWPDVNGYSDEGYWLEEGGYLNTPMTNFYEAITSNVEYP